MSNPTQQEESTKGTLFRTYNAILGYYQNFKCYKDEESKYKSMYGNGLQKGQKAFDLCTKFVKAANLVLN